MYMFVKGLTSEFFDALNIWAYGGGSFGVSHNYTRLQTGAVLAQFKEMVRRLSTCFYGTQSQQRALILQQSSQNITCSQLIAQTAYVPSSKKRDGDAPSYVWHDPKGWDRIEIASPSAAENLHSAVANRILSQASADMPASIRSALEENVANGSGRRNLRK
jgi:hypothetical protein